MVMPNDLSGSDGSDTRALRRGVLTEGAFATTSPHCVRDVVMAAQARGKICFTTGVVAMMLLLSPRLDAQGTTGSVRGTVRQTGTTAPLANAEVTIVGTRLGALSRNDGGYVITNVPTGEHRVRV